MADQLRSGIAWLAGQLQANVSQPVIYRRAGLWVAVPATVGDQLLRVHDGKGNTRVQRTDRDFCIPAALLILGGSATTPRDGDWIDLTLWSLTKRFEVTPVGSEVSWRYSDDYETIFRIHGKFLKTMP